jgi:hypothetical protein
MSQAKAAGGTVVAGGWMSAAGLDGAVLDGAVLDGVWPENLLLDGTVGGVASTGAAAGLSGGFTSVRSALAGSAAARTPEPSASAAGAPGPPPKEPWASLLFGRAVRGVARLSAGKGGTASTAVASAAVSVAPSVTEPLTDSTDSTGLPGSAWS